MPAELASVWLTRSLSQLPLHGPVSQPCTMENSKCSKGNSRSPWPGPVMPVRVLPLVLPGVPAGHVARFSPPSLYPSSSDRGNDLSYVVKYVLYRFHAIADGEFNRSCRRPHLIAISSLRISSPCDSYIQMQMISVCHFIKLQQFVISNDARQTACLRYCNFKPRRDTNMDLLITNNNSLSLIAHKNILHLYTFSILNTVSWYNTMCTWKR